MSNSALKMTLKELLHDMTIGFFIDGDTSSPGLKSGRSGLLSAKTPPRASEILGGYQKAAQELGLKTRAKWHDDDPRIVSALEREN